MRPLNNIDPYDVYARSQHEIHCLHRIADTDRRVVKQQEDPEPTMLETIARCEQQDNWWPTAIFGFVCLYASIYAAKLAYKMCYYFFM